MKYFKSVKTKKVLYLCYLNANGLPFSLSPKSCCPRALDSLVRINDVIKKECLEALSYLHPQSFTWHYQENRLETKLEKKDYLCFAFTFCCFSLLIILFKRNFHHPCSFMLIRHFVPIISPHFFTLR